MADSLRIGILSTATIGAVICKAAQALTNVEIVAVASRNTDKAAAFAAEHGINISCSYDELVSCSALNAVYVPLPTALATSWAVKAAHAGKHGRFLCKFCSRLKGVTLLGHLSFLFYVLVHVHHPN
jgi:D-xylose 1-dehydrogenase (NADP+, D-xylono-1,5-lactone-forming)